jgi:hypothetical protein
VTFYDEGSSQLEMGQVGLLAEDASRPIHRPHTITSGEAGEGGDSFFSTLGESGTKRRCNRHLWIERSSLVTELVLPASQTSDVMGIEQLATRPDSVNAHVRKQCRGKNL